MFRDVLDKLIPDKKFSGIGVIDFESWRPIFRQNFGNLAAYKDLSIQSESKLHPFWPKFWIEKEAVKRFEFYSRQFMEETIVTAKLLRPKASWGYYAYPYCFNMSPNNMKMQCPREVLRENEHISWLFKEINNFHPSLYLDSKRLSREQKMNLIEGRIIESHRLIKYLNLKQNYPKILPYFWYKYHDTNKFLSKEDVFDVLSLLTQLDVDGLIIWGSSNDVNSKINCQLLHDYIETILGPLIINTI